MSIQKISSLDKRAVFDSLPPYCFHDDRFFYRKKHIQRAFTIIVLDDDPTGTQTISGFPVLTGWDHDLLKEAICGESEVIFILTNSRAKTGEQAAEINREIAVVLSRIEVETGIRQILISRSDSTLRGHFPLEPEVICESTGKNIEGCVLIPFFAEGSRYTIQNVHYLEEDGELIPVAESIFAQDRVFGYSSSNLKEWVEEKTSGKIKSDQVRAVSLADLRSGNSQHIIDTLMKLRKGEYCIVNCAAYQDLDIFCRCYWEVFDRQKEILFRSAASLISSLIDQPHGRFLQRADLNLNKNSKGLVVVGSHVAKTTDQLNLLLAEYTGSAVEIHVQSLLQDHAEDEISRVVSCIDRLLQKGKTPIVYTSRELIALEQGEDNQQIGEQISAGLVEIVKRAQEPDFIIAKGGITSSDIATDALNVKKAMVIGQILPGISIWKLGKGSRYPDLPFVVFPGNVGKESDLLRVYIELIGKEGRNETI